MTLGLTSDLGVNIVQDLHEMMGRDTHRICGLIDCLHAGLARDGESAARIEMLRLLLTPVGPDGKALPQCAAAPSAQGPFLTEAGSTPSVSRTKRHSAA